MKKWKAVAYCLFFLFSIAFAQFQPSIVAWVHQPGMIVDDSFRVNLGTPLSKIVVRFTKLNYSGDWLTLARSCGKTYNEHINNVLCFAYPTARHLNAAQNGKGGSCWSARWLIISGKIEQERQSNKVLNSMGCPPF